jgi:hypothetical protein
MTHISYITNVPVANVSIKISCVGKYAVHISYFANIPVFNVLKISFFEVFNECQHQCFVTAGASTYQELIDALIELHDTYNFIVYNNA